MTMYHFYLSNSLGEVKAMSAPVLPRSGDVIEVDGIEITISKIKWIGNGKTLEAAPMVYTDHIIDDRRTLAQKIVTTQGVDHKISAIKEYRSATNVGLREAKDAIDLAYQQVFGPGSGFATPS